MQLKLNSNLSLNPTHVKRFVGKYLGLITIVACGGLLIYTGYFLSRLLYGNYDTTQLEQRQAQSDQAKQIRFNEKTLSNLDRLKPATNGPDTTNVGRNNPFAPN